MSEFRDIHPARRQTASELGVSEQDIETLVCADPSVLDLGDLEIVENQVRRMGEGILDILAFNKELNTYFEIEISRGEVDHRHLAHVLDYWATGVRKYTFSNHVPVLLAESLQGRYRTVLQLLPEYLPLIAGTYVFIVDGDDSAIQFLCMPVYYSGNWADRHARSSGEKSGTKHPLQSRAGVAVITALIQNPQLVRATLRTVADDAGVSLGAVSQTFSALRQEGFLSGKRADRQLSRIDELKDRVENLRRVRPEFYAGRHDESSET